MNIATDPLYTIEEAAEALRISSPTFKKIRDTHPEIFRPICVGGRVLFSASQLSRYLQVSNPHLTAIEEGVSSAAAAAAAQRSGGK